MRLDTITEIPPELHACVYGASFTGKTTAVAQLAEKYNLLWFALEGGEGPLRKLPIEWQRRVNLIKFPDNFTNPIAVETMLKVMRGSRVSLCEEHAKVSCPICTRDATKHCEIIQLNRTTPDTIVVIDSLTQFGLSGISQITKNQPDDYKLERDDWGNLKQLVDMLLSQIQTARYNIVCITHDEEVEHEDKTKKVYPVIGSSKSSRLCARAFTDVVYTYIANKKHRMASSTGYSTAILAGSRNDVKLEDIPNASLLDLFTSWKAPSYVVPECYPAPAVIAATATPAAPAAKVVPATATQAVTPAAESRADAVRRVLAEAKAARATKP